jgi:hypothetical protein
MPCWCAPVAAWLHGPERSNFAIPPANSSMTPKRRCGLPANSISDKSIVSLTKPTFRPTLEISVKSGYAYAVKFDALRGKATAFVSQEKRML